MSRRPRSTLLLSLTGVFVASTLACTSTSSDSDESAEAAGPSSESGASAGSSEASSEGTQSDSSSSDTQSEEGSSEETGNPLPFELTSTALSQGGTFPLANECGPPNGPGENISVQLSWTPAPGEVQSYAVVMHDLDFMNLVHWVIYDIPPEVLELPAGIPAVYEPATPAGSKQASIQGVFFGYLGPCSPSSVNTYELTVHALPVANLPGVSASSTDIELANLVESMSTASASLSGES